MVVYDNTNEALARILRGAVQGLNIAAEALLADSKELTPVDTTDLRKTGSVHQASPASLTSAVTYDTPYAVVQHENLDFFHPTDHNPNAQAKFLEQPAVENRHEYGGIIAAQIRRATGS